MTGRTPGTPEKQLVADALAALAAGPGIACQQLDLEPGPPGKSQVDGYITLQPPFGRRLLEIRQNLTPARIGAVAAQLRNLPGKEPRLLVTDYATPAVAKGLRECGVQFIDTLGNAWLHHEKPLVYVWVTGNKPLKPLAHKPVTTFRAKGLRVIFPLLCLAQAPAAPYRQIADWAGVALGTVANTMDDLERLGYLRKTRKGRVLENRDDLVRRWVEAYPQELRPRLKPQRFHVLHGDWWREFTRKDYERHGIWLGGEAAGAVLTRYLHPEVTTVYGRPDFARLAHRLVQPVRDDNGNFELLEPFWNFEFAPLDEVHRVCPPLLVYADLVVTGEARQLDAAAILKEEYLDVG